MIKTKTGGLLFSMMIMAVLAISPACHAVTLKIATLSPDGSYWMKTMRAAGKEIYERTEKRVKFKFYPGGVMGSDDTVLRKIRIGQLQGGAVTAGSLARYYPDASIYSYPFIFRSFDEVDYVRKHMDHLLEKGIEKAGFVTFGMAEGGFAYVMSNAPVNTFDDLRQRKLWVPSNDPVPGAVLSSMGVTPVAMSYGDVLTGLQTEMIDTVATSPIAALALQWHTNITYVLDLPVMYFAGVMAIHKKAFDKIGPDDQLVVREIMSRAFAGMDKQNRLDNKEAFAALANQGIAIGTPDEAGHRSWQHLKNSSDELIINLSGFSKDVVSMLKNLLYEYRNGKKIADKQE